MKGKLLFVGILAATLTYGVQAKVATDKARVTIPMNADKVFQGNSMIQLKAKIKKLRPELDLSKADLVKVVLRAKSQAGYGSVYVKEGQFISREETIDKSPKAQGFQKPGGFSKVVLEAPREMRGNHVWRMFLKGKIKIKNIDVVLTVPAPVVKKSAQCTSDLTGIFGQVWEQYTAQAQGQTKARAKAKACEKSQKQCQARKRQLSSQFPGLENLLVCIQR